MAQNEYDSVLEEKWEQATLANNFIFYKVMRNHPDACKHLLEILLKIQISHMEISQEEVIDIDYNAKGIRLDVFVKEPAKMYDIEVQVTDTKELPERSRYYQGLMDLDSLKAGQNYKELKDSHVIFICMEDIFKDELPIYTFENVCLENFKTKLNDRAIKHFFIAPNCAKLIEDEEVRDFFEFLISNKASTNYTTDLSRYVYEAKLNMQWRVQYMTWERVRTYAFEDGQEKGIAIGEKKKAIEAAKSFYSNGASIELIAKSLNMSIEQVKDIVTEPAV